VLRFRYNIAHDGFDIGTGMEIAWIAGSNFIPGLDYAPVALTLNRPFWNTCKYEVKQKDQAGGVIGFTGPYTDPKDCPAADCIRLDWVETPEGEPQQFQIEIKGDSSMFKDPYRVEGKDYTDRGSGPAPIFLHDGSIIKCVTITKKEGNCLPLQPLVVAIDQIVMDDRHQGDGIQGVTMVPDVFSPGQVANVVLTTDRPFLMPGITTLHMGAEVLIHDFQIVSPTQASALIEVDTRARNAGHYVSFRDPPTRFLLSSDFTISPPDPNVPLPPNIGPTVQLNVPGVVEANVPFVVTVQWDDPDDRFIQGLVAVQSLPSTAEVFNTFYHFIDTSGGPVTRQYSVPGLPPGNYKVIVVPNDGLAPELMTTVEIRVLPEPGTRFRRGNANADQDFDLSDAVFILGFLFLGNPVTLPCRDAADADDNGQVELTDAIRILGFLFLGQLPPRSPFPDCGVDPTPSTLSCESFPPCP
jgi:hypothetical protein